MKGFLERRYKASKEQSILVLMVWSVDVLSLCI